MGLLDRLNEAPFRQHVGIEITRIEDGYAEGRLSLQETYSSNTEWTVAQGGVTFTLADSLGGAAVVSKKKRPTPTIDFRIDYLNPATEDLLGWAEIVRYGSESAVVNVKITDTTDQQIAVGRGVYKTGELPGETPWDISAEE